MWDKSGNHFQLLFVFAAPQCLPLRACSVEYPPPLTNSHSCFLHPCNFSLASFLLFYFFPTKQKKTFGCRFSLTLVLFIKTTDTQGSAPQGKYVNWKYILLILGGEILFSQSATDAPFHTRQKTHYHLAFVFSRRMCNLHSFPCQMTL